MFLTSYKPTQHDNNIQAVGRYRCSTHQSVRRDQFKKEIGKILRKYLSLSNYKKIFKFNRICLILKTRFERWSKQIILFRKNIIKKIISNSQKHQFTRKLQKDDTYPHNHSNRICISGMSHMYMEVNNKFFNYPWHFSFGTLQASNLNMLNFK